MTKDNAHKFIPIIQALAEGKTIQIRDGYRTGEWIDAVAFEFCKGPECYRIKPEPPKPREVTLYRMRFDSGSPWTEWREAYTLTNPAENIEVMRVREIVEEKL